MGLFQFVKKVMDKGMMLPTGKVSSIFPEQSTKVTRDFLNTKAKIK